MFSNDISSLFQSFAIRQRLDQNVFTPSSISERVLQWESSRLFYPIECELSLDIFDKSSLVHLASWHLTIPFVFLSVNRLGAFLTLPVDRTSKTTPCSLRYYRGTLMKYLNKERLFCQSQSGWSGARCNHPIDCTQCSKNSICVGSPDHFGSRCLVTPRCPMNICRNNGRCVVIDQRRTESSCVCLCSDPFFETRCESIKHQIEISLIDIEIPSYMLI